MLDPIQFILARADELASIQAPLVDDGLTGKESFDTHVHALAEKETFVT